MEQFNEHYQLLSNAIQCPNLGTCQFYDQKNFFPSRQGRVLHKVQVLCQTVPEGFQTTFQCYTVPQSLHLSIFGLENFSCVLSGQSSIQTSSPLSKRFQEHYQVLVNALQSQNLNTCHFYDLKKYSLTSKAIPAVSDPLSTRGGSAPTPPV
jgi:hypothetical protein